MILMQIQENIGLFCQTWDNIVTILKEYVVKCFIFFSIFNSVKKINAASILLLKAFFCRFRIWWMLHLQFL